MSEIKHYINNQDFKLLMKMVKTKEDKQNKDAKNLIQSIHNIAKCLEMGLLQELDIAKFDQNLTNLILKRNGKQIYKYIEEGKSKYDLNTLIHAVILTDDMVSICNSAILGKGITKEQFLMCAKAMVQSKEAEGVVHLYRFCHKSDTIFNSFDVSSEVIEMIKNTQDEKFIKLIIRDINEREEISNTHRRIDIPYGQGLFKGATWLRDCLESYLKNIKKAGV